MTLLRNLPRYAKTDRIAINCGGEITTYAQLYERITALALHLRKNCLTGKPVAIYGDRGSDMVVGFFASILAHKTYVCLPSVYPRDRLEYIMKDCDADLLINATEEPFETDRPVLTGRDVTALCEGEVSASETEQMFADIASDAERTAIIIYTSGSTGMPKGVEISYANVEARMTACQFAIGAPEAYGTDTVKVVNPASYGFVLGLNMYYVLGEIGGTWCTAPKQVIIDTPSMVAFLKEIRPNYFELTPSLAKALMSSPDFCGEKIPTLRRLNFGGEQLHSDVVKALMARFAELSVYNAYGATETPAGLALANITPELAAEEGYMPVDDGRCHYAALLSEENTLLREEGVVGEFIFINEAIAKGYFRNPELTREIFFTSRDGNRVYRTGDLGVIRNGRMFVVGRKDNQVKISGNRVELEDVEAHMRRCSPVKDVAVVARTDAANAVSLLAFVVRKPEYADAKNVQVFLQIKSEMLKMVENYKVPQKIVFLDELPVNNSGKVDRAKLKEMGKAQ